MDFSLVTTPRKFLPTIKLKLLEKVPKLNEKQLKRLRMPLTDALADELQDLNFTKSLKIYRKILEIDSKQGQNFSVNKNQNLLKKIFKFLKEIEGKSNLDEIKIFLDIVDEIWTTNSDFDWLVEFFLIHASELVENFNLNGTKIDAIVKFTHAMALSQRLNWFRPAVILFESSFELAIKNQNWNFKNEKLCELISLQLSDCLIKLSREIRENEKDIDGALKLSKRSLKVLRMFLSDESKIYEIEAEFEYGKCFFEIENFQASLHHFNHAMALAENVKNKRKICEIFMKIGECYEKINDIEKFENYFLLSRDLAVELNDFDFQGKIYSKLGEFYLKSENYDKISTYLKAAIQCFNESKNFHKMTEIKSILAEVRAKSNFNSLIDTILRSDKSKMGKNRDYDKLALWYDRKYPLTNRHHDFYRINEEDHDLNVFIKKYYDPDEIIKIQ